MLDKDTKKSKKCKCKNCKCTKKSKKKFTNEEFWKIMGSRFKK